MISNRGWNERGEQPERNNQQKVVDVQKRHVNLVHLTAALDALDLLERYNNAMLVMLTIVAVIRSRIKKSGYKKMLKILYMYA